jgi:hypothetical protein
MPGSCRLIKKKQSGWQRRTKGSRVMLSYQTGRGARHDRPHLCDAQIFTCSWGWWQPTTRGFASHKNSTRVELKGCVVSAGKGECGAARDLHFAKSLKKKMFSFLFSSSVPTASLSIQKKGQILASWRPTKRYLWTWPLDSTRNQGNDEGEWWENIYYHRPYTLFTYWSEVIHTNIRKVEFQSKFTLDSWTQLY